MQSERDQCLLVQYISPGFVAASKALEGSDNGAFYDISCHVGAILVLVWQEGVRALQNSWKENFP